jgi:hypothetical protein
MSRIPADASLLDVIIDGTEKWGEWLGGFTDRELPMPDEATAIRKFEAFAREGLAWKGPSIEEQRQGPRRFVRWPDLEIRQAGRGIMVLVRVAHFDEWWHAKETWAGDPMGLVRGWRREKT